MGHPAPRQRRSSVDLLGYAVLTGVLVGCLTALLALPALSVVRTLAAGQVGQQWQAGLLTDDDWETVPVLVLMAVVSGAALAVLATAVWWYTADRVRRPWVPQVAAAVAAALGAWALLLVSWPVALAASLVAALTVVIATPRVAYQRVIA